MEQVSFKSINLKQYFILMEYLLFDGLLIQQQEFYFILNISDFLRLYLKLKMFQKEENWLDNAICIDVKY